MQESDYNRRSFLTTSGGLLVTCVVAGCTDESDPTPRDNETPIHSNPDGGLNDPIGESPTEEDPIANDSDSNDENGESAKPVRETPQVGHLDGLTGQTYPPDNDGYHQRRFEWTGVGSEWWYEQEIPRRLGRYYEDRFGRSSYYAGYVSDWYGQPIIEGLTDEFERMGTEYGLSDREVVNLTMAFVQQLRYTEDEVTAGFDQYSSYPVETLLNRGGDCEDTAILLAAILREMGYGSVLLGIWETDPAHMALGVKGESSIEGMYYEYGGERYYYVETTGEGWDVGQMPDDYRNASADIIEVPQTPTVVYEWESRMAGDGAIAVDAHITNVSNTMALNPSFSVSFEDTSDWNHASAETGVGNLGVLSGDTTESVTLTLEPPDDTRLRARTSLTVDGNTHDTDVSGWRSPV